MNLKHKIILSICFVIILIVLYTGKIEHFENQNTLDGIDVVYYINLKHRTDRMNLLTKQLSEYGIPQSNLVRIDAVYNKEHGGLGCSASHIKTVKTFLNSKYNKCLILEDDFMFNQPYDVVHDFFNKLKNIDYDVCMLSANTEASTYKADKTEYDFIKKVQNAQTASAYCVSKKFAPTLLQTLEEGYIKLQNDPQNKNAFMNDMYWKIIQPQSLWYISNPILGIQRPSFSDIENTNVDYNI